MVKAHYGRYYSAIERRLHAAIVPSTTPLVQLHGRAGRQPDQFHAGRRPRNLRVDPNLKAPYSDQYMVQVEHELMTNLGLQVNYVHKRGDDYGGMGGHDGRLRAVPYVDNVGTDASGQTFMV